MSVDKDKWYQDVYLPALGSNTGETIKNFAALDWFALPPENSYVVYLVTSFDETGAWKPEFHFYRGDEQFEYFDDRVKIIPNKRLPSVYCGTVLLSDNNFPVRYPLKTSERTLYANAKLYADVEQPQKQVKIATRQKKATYPKDNPLRKVHSARPSFIKRQAVLARDNYTCCKCGVKEKLVVDHINPLGLGGDNDKNNLQTLCRKCDAEKGCHFIDYRKSDSFPNDFPVIENQTATFPNDFPYFPPLERSISDCVRLS